MTGWLLVPAPPPWWMGILQGLLVGWLWLGWRRRRARVRILQGEPEPPENVRIRFGDGRLVPVECVYAGLSQGADGLPVHQWVAVTELAAATIEGAELSFDKLPARCAITLAVRHDLDADP